MFKAIWSLPARASALWAASTRPNSQRTLAFKTPTLRSIKLSGPYFHVGSVAKLEDAVRYMAGGGKPDPNKSAILRDTQLTDKEVGQVAAFLKALTSTEK